MDAARRIEQEAASALGVEALARFDGLGRLRAAYDVDALAAASVAAFGDAVAALLAVRSARPAVSVHLALTGGWFAQALRPVGWTAPSPWDAVAGDYEAADGWLRLHTNAPRHRAAALAVLGVRAERADVAAAVAGWPAGALEAAVGEAGGAAAELRAVAAWAAHPQGVAVAAEPLVAVRATDAAPRSPWRPDPVRPLDGVRVLDLTRVLAGPVATRALAGLGASVLRVDPPDWDEPAVVPDMTLGKRTARIDARTADGLAHLRALISAADVLVHGYRRDALERLGLGEDERRALRPGLVDVALTAYGWTGPWASRRGFDSLVQMSAGIAERGMRTTGADRPVPLPVQALDHATGWFAAAAAVAGLRDRLTGGRGSTARLSLARTALALPEVRAPDAEAEGGPLPSGPWSTPWGAAELLEPALHVGGARFGFDRGPAPLGADDPRWA